MSRHLESSLRACYVDMIRQPKEPPALSEMKYKGGGGGRWFCPGCGVSTEEKIPWNIRRPQCGRSIWEFVYQLIEHHPHRSKDGRWR